MCVCARPKMNTSIENVFKFGILYNTYYESMLLLYFS